MDITLLNFQIKAIADLTAAMEQPSRDIILKSCTGSGKTMVLSVLWVFTYFLICYKPPNWLS